MGKLTLETAHEDERGTIIDLLTGGSIDAVTALTLKKGAVRGNHFHKKTRQWTYVIAGQITYGDKGKGEAEAEFNIGLVGDLFFSEAGFVHAIRAEEDSSIIVFTSGPRAGDDYETDTFRTEPPLLW